LWQGDSVLEADSLELLRSARVLNAVGNVHGVFPQAPSTLEKGVSSQAVARTASAIKDSSLPPVRKPELWRVTAGTLAYLDAENRAHLEHDVVVQSKEQRMQAPRLDLFFSRSAKASTAPVNAEKAVETSQQITRAVGEGGVTIEQGDRRASAERGEYTASNGKFVMSGGNPTLFDGSEGTTTGRELTFFLADDTIIVGSEKGSRTLTKHRVEK
jgi:lipopolysaccharide export system protein LptA